MNTREKKLAIGMASVFAVGLGAKYVWPALKPALDLRAGLERAHEDREEAFDKRDALEEKLNKKYAEYVRRTGGTDPDALYQVLNQKLAQLVQDANVGQRASIKPNEPTVDKKTHVASITFSVTVNGTMTQCHEFVRSVYRLPHLVRFNSLKLTPTQASQHPTDDSVKLDAEIEVIVPPSEPDLANPAGKSPEWRERQLTDGSTLSGWRPFNPHVDQPPVTVEEPIVAAPDPTPPPVVDAGPPTDPNASAQFLRGIIAYGVDEAVIEDRATQRTEYIAVGDSLDAGKLVLLHALGAVVHKHTPEQDFGYFVYPIGESLVRSVKLEDAASWPEIQVAMMQYFDAQKRLRRETDDMGPHRPEDQNRSDRPAPVEPDGIASAHGGPDAFVGPPSVAAADDNSSPRRRAPLVGTSGLSAAEAVTADEPGAPEGAAPQPNHSRPVQEDADASRPKRPRATNRPVRTPAPETQDRVTGAPEDASGGPAVPAPGEPIPPE